MTGIMNAIVGTNFTQGVTSLGLVASLQDKVTTPLTKNMVATAPIPSGTLLVFAVCHDNSTASTPTVSLSNTTGVAWTSRANPASSATATAGAGIFLRVYTLLTTADIASGATITTVTFTTIAAGGPAKALAIWGFTKVTNTLRNTVATGTSTGGTPTATTTGTALVAKDLVVGVIGSENNALATRDSDTTNGSWSLITGINTIGGNANTNVSVGLQYKIVTATGNQVFNPTSANDSAVAVFAMIPS